MDNTNAQLTPEEQTAKSTRIISKHLRQRGKANGMKSLVCGILAIVMGPAGLIGIAMAIIAIIMAGKERGTDMAETGRFLGIVGLIIAGILFVIMLIFLSSIMGLVRSAAGMLSSGL